MRPGRTLKRCAMCGFETWERRAFGRHVRQGHYINNQVSALANLDEEDLSIARAECKRQLKIIIHFLSPPGGTGGPNLCFGTCTVVATVTGLRGRTSAWCWTKPDGALVATPTALLSPTTQTNIDPIMTMTTAFPTPHQHYLVVTWKHLNSPLFPHFICAYFFGMFPFFHSPFR
jgi:hypothetical protein